MAPKNRIHPTILAAITAVMLTVAVTAVAWHTKIAAPPALPEPAALQTTPGAGGSSTLNLDHPQTMDIVNVTVHRCKNG